VIFLTETEKQEWRELGVRVLSEKPAPRCFDAQLRPNLRPLFHFYAGSLLAGDGDVPEAGKWFMEGAAAEEDLLFSNAFIMGFLERQGRLAMPEVVFADPRPFIHFAGVPLIKAARERFIQHCSHILPEYRRPLRIMDIGCGNGALLADLLRHLRAVGRVGDIGEILLIDSSPAMIELAVRTVGAIAPRDRIRTLPQRVEEVSGQIEGFYDIALSSLAYHHMPLEKKQMHLDRLKNHIGAFVLFELNANNDTPEVRSPELAVSVYQSYGRIIDAVFRHDAPIDVAQSCVDRFLLAEEVSLLTQPRGERTEYHMLRLQWHRLFGETLDGFTCWGDSTAYGDEYFDLFTLVYGR